MSVLLRFCAHTAMLMSLATNALSAAEPVTVDNVVEPAPNSPNEPFADQFSLEKAAHFLDSASLQWQHQRKCMTCHTNYVYLYARPAITADDPAHQQVRQFAEQLVSQRWEEHGPRWDAEVVATAAALAFNDAATTKSLHPATRVALDRMWTVQRDDGGWSWLNCDWPPMESDDHYGVTLAAIAVGVAPENYQRTPAAKAGLEKIRDYLADNPGTTLHHRMMVLWADSYVDDLLTDSATARLIDELRSLQQTDGGWAVATFGDWERADGSPQELTTSDGYGTGFAVFILRRAGVPAADPALEKGIAWLKRNQRQSGRWFTRSLHKDSKHFLTHAGTAMAVMAIDACEER